MAKMFIDEKDWEHINKLVRQHDESIKRLERQIQPHSIDITSIPTNLTSLQNDIFRYVSEHPDCSKADVERSLKDKGAKVTIRNAIASLVEYKFIRDEISKNNKQTHSLLVNNDSELSLLTQELDKFEKAYFSLIDRFNGRFKDLDSDNRHSFQKYGAFEDILSIYQFVLRTYLMKGIYKWPRRVSDDEILSRLYTILFVKLSKMQMELAKRSRIIFEKFDLVENMVLNSSIPPVSRDVLIKSSKMFHYEQELDGVLHIVDNIKSEVEEVAFRSSGGKIRIGGRGNRVYSPIVVPGKGKMS